MSRILARKGLSSAVAAATGLSGEFFYTTDTKELYMSNGDGAGGEGTQKSLVGQYIIDDSAASNSTTKTYSASKINTLVNTLLTGGVELKGVFEAAGETDFTDIVDPKKGDFYYVNGSATILGIDLNGGDMIIINKDVTGSPVAADIWKVDNTENPNNVLLAAEQTLTNKTIDGDSNTITDLALSSLKTVLADADKFIKRDATGAVVSATISSSDITDFTAAAQDAVGGAISTTDTIALAYDTGTNTFSANVKLTDTSLTSDTDGLQLHIKDTSLAVDVDGVYVSVVDGGTF